MAIILLPALGVAAKPFFENFFGELGRRTASGWVDGDSDQGITLTAKSPDEFQRWCEVLVGTQKPTGTAPGALEKSYPEGYILIASSDSGTRIFQPDPVNVSFLGDISRISRPELSGDRVKWLVPRFAAHGTLYDSNLINIPRRVGVWPVGPDFGARAPVVEILEATSKGIVIALGVR